MDVYTTTNKIKSEEQSPLSVQRRKENKECIHKN